MSSPINHFLGYILWHIADSIGLAAVNLTQLALKAAILGEITHT